MNFDVSKFDVFYEYSLLKIHVQRIQIIDFRFNLTRLKMCLAVPNLFLFGRPCSGGVGPPPAHNLLPLPHQGSAAALPRPPQPQQSRAGNNIEIIRCGSLNGLIWVQYSCCVNMKQLKTSEEMTAFTFSLSCPSGICLFLARIFYTNSRQFYTI